MIRMFKTAALISAAGISEFLLIAGQPGTPLNDPLGTYGKVFGTLGLIACLIFFAKMMLAERKQLQDRLDAQAEHEKSQTAHTLKFLEGLNEKNNRALLTLADALRERPCLFDLDTTTDNSKKE